jgi:hypothetical protein
MCYSPIRGLWSALMDEDFTSESLLHVFVYESHAWNSVLGKDGFHVFLLDLHLYMSYDRGWTA